MKLKTESYKGVAIQVVKNVLGGANNTSTEVLARFKYSGKPQTFKGYSKEEAVSKAKKAIDKII